MVAWQFMLCICVFITVELSWSLRYDGSCILKLGEAGEYSVCLSKTGQAGSHPSSLGVERAVAPISLSDRLGNTTGRPIKSNTMTPAWHGQMDPLHRPPRYVTDCGTTHDRLSSAGLAQDCDSCWSPLDEAVSLRSREWASIVARRLRGFRLVCGAPRFLRSFGCAASQRDTSLVSGCVLAVCRDDVARRKRSLCRPRLDGCCQPPGSPSSDTCNKTLGALLGGARSRMCAIEPGPSFGRRIP